MKAKHKKNSDYLPASVHTVRSKARGIKDTSRGHFLFEGA